MTSANIIITTVVIVLLLFVYGIYESWRSQGYSVIESAIYTIGMVIVFIMGAYIFGEPSCLMGRC